MKLETLAARLAAKVDEPALEKAILQGEASGLPDRCLIWTGRKTVSGQVMRKLRDHNKLPYMSLTVVQPYALVQFEKKLQYAHNLVFQLVNGPEPRRLRNLCGESLCINPLHWAPIFTNSEPEQGEEEEVPDFSDDWPDEEVEEMLDLYLMTNREVDFEHPLLVDIPEAQIRAVLKKMGKEHLL